MSARNLIFILGDQLSMNLSSLKDADKQRDVLLMCEVAEETNYVPHHRKKLVFILSAMRHHAERLKDDGWNVDYVKLDDAENSGRFESELGRAVVRHQPEGIILTEPGERRVLTAFRTWADTHETPLEIREDDRFLASHEEFRNWAKGRKSLRMEYFYREMRKKLSILMDGDDPEGGQWNYDSENRKPVSGDLFIPKRLGFEPDAQTQDVLDLIERHYPNRFGELKDFRFAVTAEDAEKALDHFISDALPSFGDYQDAMLEGHKFLWHSLVSPYINLGLLDPLLACQKAEQAYRDGKAPLNAVEGFIRQIIGWREYIRGIYWLSDDDYVHQNALKADRPLPWFYWSGETKMNCIRQVVRQTREEAYAHHIQRLMVTGVFALLAGIDPFEVHEWYLAVYADAFEWVEAPNTIGMALYADGGRLASKPYAASGAYINRMSDYCEKCHYAVSKKTDDKACPFNSLYWDFLIRNREALKHNGRISRAYSTWDRMNAQTRTDYLKTAEKYLNKIEEV